MQSGVKGADMKEKAVTGVIKMWYSLKARLISLAVLCCPDVCAYFPFMHLMARLTGMKAKPGWWSLCLNLTVYFLCREGGGVRSRPMWFCQSLRRASRGTVCLHHAGLPSAAVLLFQALFIDQKKTAVFDVSCFLSSARTFDHMRRD